MYGSDTCDCGNCLVTWHDEKIANGTHIPDSNCRICKENGDA